MFILVAAGRAGSSVVHFFLVAAGRAVLIVCFFTNFFIFFLPSFAFICLQQPSFAFIGEGSERGFGGGFGRPARAAWAGWAG
jgi:hypothetical protein